MGPQAPHPRQVVFELRELHLQLSLGAVRVVGEDVQDHGRAVDHGHAEGLLQIPLLPRHELVVARDQVRVRPRDLRLDLGELAAADVAVGIRAAAHLHRLARGRHAGGAEEFLQLGEGIAVTRRGGQHAQAKGALPGARVLDAAARDVRAPGATTVARSLHPRQV